MTAKNSREQLEIEYRRQCVKDTWIKLGVFDVTQDQITEALAKDFGIEVDRSTVSRDLGVIKKRIKEQTADELRTEFFAGYMRLITQAREGWRRSLEDAVTETSEVIETPGDGEKNKEANQRLKISTRTTGQSGNASFLEQEQKAYRAMREMFGVDAPSKHELTGEMAIAEMPLEEWKQRQNSQRQLTQDVFDDFSDE